MQILAGRDGDMSCESVGISGEESAILPHSGKAADELDEGAQSTPRISFRRLRSWMHAAGARQEEGTCLMVHVGIDIAKNDHVACAVDESGGKLTRPLPFKNNEAGFEKLLAWLEGIVQDPSEAFVGMEGHGALLDGVLFVSHVRRIRLLCREPHAGASRAPSSSPCRASRTTAWTAGLSPRRSRWAATSGRALPMTTCRRCACSPATSSP